MKRALTLIAATAALTPVLTPATAHARPTVAAPTISVSPGTVVPLAKSSKTVTIRVTAPGLGEYSYVSVDARGPKGDYDGDVVDDPDGDGVFEARLQFDRMNEAGGWKVETTIYDGNTGDDYAGPSASFSVKRHTKLSANAAPEPVKKGGTISVGGRLTRLTQYGYPSDYVAYSGQRVYVYFKRKGTTKWVSKGYVTTDKYGKYVKKFKAAYDGYWRTGFAGTSMHAPVLSSGDFVDVR
jgi:hypothetical protein